MNNTYCNSPAYIDCEFLEIHQQGVHRQAGKFGELLDLFFARLLLSGTGDSPPALLGLGKSKRTR